MIQERLARIGKKKLEKEKDEDFEVKKGLEHEQMSLGGFIGAVGFGVVKANYLSSYAIYNHHTSCRHKDVDLEDIKNATPQQVIDLTNKLLKNYQLNETLDPNLDISLDTITNTTATDPLSTVVKICVIQADRWISSIQDLDNKELKDCGDFCQNFVDWKEAKQEGSDSFNGLYDYQEESVKQCIDIINILRAPAGSGKTRMAISWLQNKNHRNKYIVAPRNTICHSLWQTIDTDASAMGVSYKTRQIVLASEIYQQEGNSSIYQSELNISNIDSVLGLYFRHNKCNNLINLLTDPLVVDEFHEMVQPNALYYVFTELIQARELLKSPTLLMSATPIQHWNVVKKVNLVSIKYPQHIDTKHFFTEESIKEASTLHRINTIKEMQGKFVEEKGEWIYHGKYDENDKKTKIERLLKDFGKESEYKGRLYTTSIAECSLNISLQNAVIDLSSPESFLQTLGRVLRFGEQKDSKIQVVFRSDRSNTTYICSTYDNLLYKNWCNFVKSNIINKTLKKSEVYEIIDHFYKNNSDLQKKYLKDVLIKAKEDMNRITPKQSFNKKQQTGQSTSSGLREQAGFYVGYIVNNELKLITCQQKDRGVIGILLNGDFKNSRNLAPQSLVFSNITLNRSEIFKTLNTDNIFKAAKNSTQSILLQNGNNYFQEYCWDENNIPQSIGVKL